MTPVAHKQLETDLWAAADNLRANSDLKSSEYSTPVPGLVIAQACHRCCMCYGKDVAVSSVLTKNW